MVVFWFLYGVFCWVGVDVYWCVTFARSEVRWCVTRDWSVVGCRIALPRFGRIMLHLVALLTWGCARNYRITASSAGSVPVIVDNRLTAGVIHRSSRRTSRCLVRPLLRRHVFNRSCGFSCAPLNVRSLINKWREIRLRVFCLTETWHEEADDIPAWAQGLGSAGPRVCSTNIPGAHVTRVHSKGISQ